jgi:hypothetical protein
MSAQAEPLQVPARNRRSVGVWVCWSLGLLLLYFLSYGPVVLYEGRHPLQGKGLQEFIHAFYQPWLWTYDHTIFHRPLQLYLHLWTPHGHQFREGEMYDAF